MLEKMRGAWEVKQVRNRLLFLLLSLVVIRLGAHIPIPGLNKSALAGWGLISGAASFFDLLSGGSLSGLTVFALSVTPVITASIIIELMSVVIPRLGALKEDGEEGRKKKAKLTKFLGLFLAVLQAIGTVLMLSRSGHLLSPAFLSALTAIFALTAGTSFLMWLGDRITENGFGNGTSFILMVNIVSRMPQMARTLYARFMQGKGFLAAAGAGAIILLCLLLLIALVVKLEGGERRVPVVHAGGRMGRTGGKQDSYIPLKANMAGVIPVIFASTVLSLPGLIYTMTGSASKLLGALQAAGTESNWFDAENPLYTLGFFASIFLVLFFAYFYTEISFSPRETAQNLQKRGSTIPGIRPGRQTAIYLEGIVKRLIVIGAIGLIIVTALPTVLSAVSGAGISLGGTSLIIASGVILEIMRAANAELAMRAHGGFLCSGKGVLRKDVRSENGKERKRHSRGA